MNNIKTNRLFLTSAALIFAAYLCSFLCTSSNVFLWLVNTYELNSEKQELLHQYVNDFVWLKMQVFLLVCFSLIVYLYYRDRTFFSDSKKAVMLFFLALLKEFKSLSRKTRIFFTLIISLFAVCILYYSSIIPMQLDELETWMYFVNRGPLVCVAYYPSNNNHVAYSLLSVLWNVFLSPLWAVRMVSMLSAVGVVVLFYFICKRKYSQFLTWTGMAVLMSSAAFVWYAVQGRGYVLELLSLMMIAFVLFNMESGRLTDRLLIFFNAFAVYIIPVALIPLGLLTIYYSYSIYSQSKDELKRVLKVAAYSFVFTLLLYAPVWIFSDWMNVFNNPFVQRISFSEVPFIGATVYGPRLWDFVTGTDGVLSILLAMMLGGSALLIGVKKERRFILPLIVLLFPLGLLLVYPVLIFERTWLWLVVIFIYWLLELFSWMMQKKSKVTLAIVSTMTFLLITANVLRLYNTQISLNEHAKKISEIRLYLQTHLQGKKVSVCNDALYNHLRFYEPTDRIVYQLLPCNAVEQADVLLEERNAHSFIPGKLLWSDGEDVLYLPK